MLVERVLSFISRARSSPVDASDPRVLEELEKAALKSQEHDSVALAAAVAPWTYEGRVLMPGAIAQSDRQPIRVPFQSKITGMMVTVSSIVFPHVSVPTLDDIDIAIDATETRDTFTIAKGVTSNGSTLTDGNFVTASSIDVRNQRRHGIILGEINNEVGVTFRWKPGPAVFDDCILTLALFVLPLRGMKRE